MILNMDEAHEELLSLYEFYFSPTYYSINDKEKIRVIKRIRMLELYMNRSINQEFQNQFKDSVGQ